MTAVISPLLKQFAATSQTRVKLVAGSLEKGQAKKEIEIIEDIENDGTRRSQIDHKS